MAMYPTPHLNKLRACLANRSTPESDRAKLHEAIRNYQDWIARMDRITAADHDSVESLVQLTEKQIVHNLRRYIARLTHTSFEDIDIDIED